MLFRSASEESFDLIEELILKFLSEKAKHTDKVTETADCWSAAIKIFAETDSLNLDKKQALINIIVNICKKI